MSGSPEDISHISGNASDKTKRVLSSVHRIFTNRTGNANAGPLFGEAIQKRLKVTEVSVNQKAEEPQRLEGKVVLETTIEEGECPFLHPVMKADGRFIPVLKIC